MKRRYESEILDWIDNGTDALLVTGVRQSGKTYLIRECLKNSHHSFVEFNFVERKEMLTLFNHASNAEDIILRMSVLSNIPLVKGETIVFFDEVQEYKDIMTSIKFLVEEGSFKYILSGSLLGVELYNLRSAPVGSLQTMEMYPLTFMEFVETLGVSLETIENLRACYLSRKQVDDFIHNKMMDLFYLYQIIGGMPEAVEEYIRTNDIQKVSEIHRKINAMYRIDFTKYEEKYSLKLKEIYDCMASELNSKNKRFKLNKVGKNMVYERVENDFLWLKDAGVALAVYNIQEPKQPLQLSENRSLFKLFFSDVGLLTSQYSNAVKIKILNKDKDINNGALFENAVAQELIANQFKLYYYNSKKQGELDFVIEMGSFITPIEVKSGKDYKKHSALDNVLSNTDYDLKEAFVLSNKNVEVIGKRTYMPIYMIMFFADTRIDNPIYKIDLSGL